MLKKRNKKLTFKNNDLYRSYISKINNTFLECRRQLTIC